MVAEVEPRRATCRARIVPNNPIAFPPLHQDVQVPRSTGPARAAIPGGQTLEVRAMQKQLPACAEAAYNPLAFPPLHQDVQVPRSTGGARAAIHGGQMQELEQRRRPAGDLHGCRKVEQRRSDCRDAGSYDSREGGGRVAPGAATENHARLHGWRR